ncbi:proline-rich receptor-like protein kinase PERK1 [Andrographis paniculata]|uniref:proline-rich receptor-like protein kinase PERK1 n=1 Tax=Andrographis paniculata TaxID=175694 RepID=UPI0021E81E73|nr:proline-rich receptor-like protein kinase PERK1 [Andrographis paniculata]
MSAPPPGVVPDPITPPSPVDFLYPPSPLGKASSQSSNRTTLIALGVGIGIGGLVVLVCVGIFVLWYKRRKRKRFSDGGFAHAQEHKEDPFQGPHHSLQQQTPQASNVSGQPKTSAPLGVSSHLRLSSQEEFSPPAHISGGSGNSAKPVSQAGTDSRVCTSPAFTYDELARATENFSARNLLGQGGFGYVHKGVLSNGLVVAIKQLKVGSGQGEREFQAEVETISSVNHKHLVSLVGHCISETQMLLVYEFVPNQTLEFHLHGKGITPINWATRMKIALGAARGLRYLHEDCHPKIIHRDIKSANILLDENFEAKVADFGLARFSADTDTHVSTRVMGTFGYLAPEYALTGKLTEKSDVFSFGVVLLELITGRRPIDKSQYYLDDNIIDWARPLLTQALENGNFDCLADSRLQKDYDSTEMARVVACAAACVRHLSRRRPRMSQIVLALEGKTPLEDLHDGIRPGHSTMFGSHGSIDYDLDASYDTTQYKEDLMKFRKMALQSVDITITTSEFSGPTSDFGIQPSESSSDGLQKPQ